jgi:3-hydroxymyristoyl/3-hydroxydecanoyl-(acyl carrier protein) dehydratase
VGASTSFTVSADHPALAGHFPGVPILPGVLLLDETLRLLGQAESLELTEWRIGRAKFLKPVRPGEALLVEHDRLANGSVRFTISTGGQPVVVGMLVPATRVRADGQPRR